MRLNKCKHIIRLFWKLVDHVAECKDGGEHFDENAAKKYFISVLKRPEKEQNSHKKRKIEENGSTKDNSDAIDENKSIEVDSNTPTNTPQNITPTEESEPKRLTESGTNEKVQNDQSENPPLIEIQDEKNTTMEETG